MNANDTTKESLRASLESLDGVRRAFVDGPPWSVFLICEPSVVNPATLEIDARAFLARAGLTAAEAQLQLGFVAPPPRRHRVRFVRAMVESESTARAMATVALEWNGAMFEENEEGDASPVSALRLCAGATIRALEALIEGALQFQLVGIKTVHVFDGDLVVALLRTEQMPGRQLIGTALVSFDPHRAAALAVLNATNRVLGNYLSVHPEGSR